MRTSLAVQWIRLSASNAGGMDSITGQGTRISHVMPHGKKKKNDKTKIQTLRKEKPKSKSQKIMCSRCKGL